MRKPIALLACLIAVPVGLQAQDPIPPDTTIAHLIQARVDAGWTPGIVVGIIRPDGSRQVLSYGTAGPERTLNGETVFEIGSITKAFTGILLAEMATRGEVRLDQPVAELLPRGTRVPERNGKAITLVDLSTQSSGLPRLPDNMPFADPRNPYADYTDSLLFAFLAGYTLPRDIGVTYEYSNLGVGLLGNALARRAGTSYESLVRDRILGPLRMGDTRITIPPELRGRVAQGHDGEGAPTPMWDLPALAGAGALRSTADDMLTFLAANINGVPGPLGEALTMARQPRTSAGIPELQVGLGWHIRTRNGRQIVWHNGGTGGYRSFAGYDPERRAGVVLLTNSANDSDDIALHLLDSTQALDSSRTVAAVALPEPLLQEYVGEYELAPGFTIVITRDGTRLFGQATGQGRFQLFARGRDDMYLRVVPARVEFQRQSGGPVTGLMLYQGGQEIPGRKIR